MIKTGIEKLDQILGGGLRGGTIIDIFGSSGTGKTQLALQIIVNSLLEKNKILYQDTTGNFRPERLLEMGKPKNLNIQFLDEINVERITNVKEQQNSLSKITESNFSLVIIDNITDLFSFEYPKEDQILEKIIQFSKYAKRLSQIAHDLKIPIIVTNMMRKIDDTEKENLDSIISSYTHIKIKLIKKQPHYEGQVFLNPMKENRFFYTMTKEGLIGLT